jgi:tellurite resistance protein TerC
MIFAFLAVPRELQHRVLFWGILGVVVLRAVMIGFGSALVAQASWVLYLFGAFLVVTGIKMMWLGREQPDLSRNPAFVWLRRRLRVTPDYRGSAFFVREVDAQSGRRVLWATPLFLALVMIEMADLVFAVDSLPAIFAITTDPFIVYTSNIFAVLGLRALYFALAAMLHRFAYLKYALAIVLVFIGAKIFAVNLVGKVPPLLSLCVVASLIAGGIAFSVWKTRRDARGDLANPDAAGTLNALHPSHSRS